MEMTDRGRFGGVVTKMSTEKLWGVIIARGPGYGARAETYHKDMIEEVVALGGANVPDAVFLSMTCTDDDSFVRRCLELGCNPNATSQNWESFVHRHPELAREFGAKPCACGQCPPKSFTLKF